VKIGIGKEHLGGGGGRKFGEAFGHR
jgi:hypothetical protein